MPGVMPHCDPRILHSPGECEFCDMHPDMQLKRSNDGVNFTGHNDPKLKKCPADEARGSGHAQWPGNVARPKEWTLEIVDKEA